MNRQPDIVDALLEAIEGPVFVVRAVDDTVEGLMVAACNAAADRWLSGEVAGIRGQPIVTATRGPSGQVLGAILDACLSTGAHPVRAELCGDDADRGRDPRLTVSSLPGRQAAVRVEAAAVERDGPLPKASPTEQARDTRLLAQVSDELEQFVYVVSHDLQAPLRAMSAYSELLARRYADSLDARGERYIEHIGDGARQLRSMLDDLLVFSRLGRHAPAAALVDLDAVAERVRGRLERRITATHTRFSWSPLPTVPGVATLLEQLLLNLVDNAITFARPDVPPLIRVCAREAGTSWSLTVEDNGPGIPPRHASAVFEPFRVLDPERTHGTGMGLAICRRIAALHRGHIRVEPSSMMGTAVIVELPIDPEAAR